MSSTTFICLKCECTNYSVGRIRTTGSGLSRFLNLQNKRFDTISCSQCGYTEIYKQDGGGIIGNIFDILTN
ncbi:MAG: zinc ribbon domain-containing protein [Chloroflexota bacterium]|nr:zinc ribbon domain-containing protein [Chloroflexota bacterium]